MKSPNNSRHSRLEFSIIAFSCHSFCLYAEWMCCFMRLFLLAQSKITSKLKLDYFLAIFHKLHKVTLSYCRAHTDELYFFGFKLISWAIIMQVVSCARFICFSEKFFQHSVFFLFFFCVRLYFPLDSSCWHVRSRNNEARKNNHSAKTIHTMQVATGAVVNGIYHVNYRKRIIGKKEEVYATNAKVRPRYKWKILF